MKRHCFLGREKEEERNGKSVEMMRTFIFRQDMGGMPEIALGFPCIFGRGVSLPCGQAQSSSRRSLMRNNVIHFVFFFVIYEVRRRL